MAKLLDLDALFPAKKQIVIGGVKHDLQPLTVRLFALAQSHQAKNIEEQTPAEQIKAGVSIVAELLPSMTTEEITKMPVEFIQSIITFAFNEGEEINEENTGEDAKS